MHRKSLFSFGLTVVLLIFFCVELLPAQRPGFRVGGRFDSRPTIQILPANYRQTIVEWPGPGGTGGDRGIIEWGGGADTANNISADFGYNLRKIDGALTTLRELDRIGDSKLDQLWYRGPIAGLPGQPSPQPPIRMWPGPGRGDDAQPANPNSITPGDVREWPGVQPNLPPVSDPVQPNPIQPEPGSPNRPIEWPGPNSG